MAIGFSSPAGDTGVTRLDLNDILVPHPQATFLMRVAGESMRNAGILDGDYVVVDRSVAPQSGQVVVGVVHGEMTLKRFHRLKDGRAALQAENPDFPEFVIGEELPAEIWGVVVGVVRKLR